MPGLLDLIAARNPEQAGGLLSDLVAGPRNRLAGLLNDPSGFLQSALSDIVPTDQQVREQLARYRMPLFQDYAMGPSEYDNKLRDIALGALTVYHGSPHKFDKFDMSKIGSGEGAQAYGHGLYFAESPEVAKSYAKKLEFNDNETQDLAEYFLGRADGNVKQAIKDLRIAASNEPKASAQYSAASDWLAAGSPKQNPSSLYKVDLPDEAISKMLDWDKPLSQQTSEVKSALGKIASMSTDETVKRVLTDPRSYGDSIHKALTWLGDNTALRDDRIHAAELLRANGIHGIRYLDQASRGVGNGTSNFVVFDDTLPTVLERNGVKLK